MQQIFDIENCVQPWVVGKEVKVRFLTTRKMGCLNFIGCKIRKSNRNRTNFTAKKLVSSLFRVFYVASCPILHFKALTLYFLSVPNLPSPTEPRSIYSQIFSQRQESPITKSFTTYTAKHNTNTRHSSIEEWRVSVALEVGVRKSKWYDLEASQEGSTQLHLPGHISHSENIDTLLDIESDLLVIAVYSDRSHTNSSNIEYLQLFAHGILHMHRFL